MRFLGESLKIINNVFISLFFFKLKVVCFTGISSLNGDTLLQSAFDKASHVEIPW